jgi:hypothetical protein
VRTPRSGGEEKIYNKFIYSRNTKLYDSKKAEGVQKRATGFLRKAVPKKPVVVAPAIIAASISAMENRPFLALAHLCASCWYQPLTKMTLLLKST